MNKLILTTLGLVIAIGFALGCGSGEDEATSADEAPPLTKAQFIKRADAICAKASKEQQVAAAAWVKELPGGPSEAEEKFAQGIKKIVPPLMHKKATRLEALPAPEGDEKAVAEIIDLIKQIQRSIEREDEADTSSSASELENKASDYGLKLVCWTL